MPQLRLMASAAEKLKAEADIRAMQNLLPFNTTTGDQVFKERNKLLKEIIDGSQD
jgi:hypothetical protein